MSLNRTEQAKTNIFFALLVRAYQLIIPFFIRTLFIHKIGIEYLGLNSLFSSVLGVLNMAELGFGTALVFSMYKPVAQKKIDEVCALINLYKRCYRIVGSVILFVGIMLTPLIPKLISADLPKDVNLYVLYYIQLIGTVSTYFFFSYKNCLFVAHQRNDILSKISLLMTSIQFCLQVVILLLISDYYLYISIMPVLSIIENVIKAIICDKLYPQYIPRGQIDRSIFVEIVRKVRALFVVKLGSIVLNSVDSIVISAFLGLSLLGIYNNYYYIVSSVVGIVGLLTSSIVSILGHSVVTESKEKNYKDFIHLSFWNFWLIGWFSVCLVCLYQPFMLLWVGEKYMLPSGMVISFALYFFVLQSNQVAGAYKDAAGIWAKDQLRPLITALINLGLNLILVKIIGLYGIIISTVISLMIINTPWLVINVCRLIFERSPITYFYMWIRNLIFTIIICIICIILCDMIPFNGIVGLCLKGMICATIPNIIYLLLYLKTKIFKESFIVIEQATRGKIKYPTF